MKRATIVIIVSALIMAILMFAMAFNLQFSIMSMFRSLAVVDGFEDDYITMLEKINEFAESGDYQKWLVTSGGTYFGKFVRIAVMSIEPLLFIKIGQICLNNVSYIMRKITKKFKNKARKVC